MSNVQKTNKSVEKLQKVKIKDKFKISFKPVYIGFAITVVFAFLNILIYAGHAGVGLFSSFSRAVGIILVFLSVILNIFLITTVSKSLTSALIQPIQELQKAVQEIKFGKFDIDVAYSSTDELGVLANDLREACVHIKEMLGDAGYVLGEMAEGKFDVMTQKEDSYIGEFAILLEGIRKLKDQMDNTIREIKISSERVMTGADQMAGNAQDLAEGATNQASAVEELAATIESVTNISEESAENAEKAATSATAAAEDAKKNREEIERLTDAMERITATSREIENIIVAIEDIASQTNLLSLNASIEAARAGEAGRGFAVVADQIGKLAADSAQSAVTTKELIGKCLDEVQAGNQILNNTIESFGTVLANMESFVEMASGAAEASKAQVNMLKEIEQGMEQITEVVQNNTGAAQETSAVSQELSAQATTLEQLVERFVLE